MFVLNIRVLPLIFFLQGYTHMKVLIIDGMGTAFHEILLADIVREHERHIHIINNLILEPLPTGHMSMKYNWGEPRIHINFLKHLTNMGIYGGYDFIVKAARKASPMITNFISNKIYKFGVTNGLNKSNKVGLKFILLRKILNNDCSLY